MTKKILILSGGHFAAVYAASLIGALKLLDSSLNIKALCDVHLREVGMDLLGADSAVADESSGIIEKVSSETEVFSVFKKYLNEETYDCLVMIDFDDSKFRYVKEASKRGIKLVQYNNPPTVELSNKFLTRTSAAVDRALLTFPHLAPLYESGGVNAEFVGHPLVDLMGIDMTRDEAKYAVGYDDRYERPIAILPSDFPAGSDEEMADMFRLIVTAAAEGAAASIRKVRILIPEAERYDRDLLSEIVKICPARIKCIDGQRKEALRASHTAVVTSGAATLEAMMVDTPPILVQQSSKFKSALSSLMGKKGYLSVPNIISGKRLTPELLNKQANHQNVSEEVCGLVEDTVAMQLMVKEMIEIKNSLGSPGTIKKAAEAVYRLL